jgi:hypothetical protein
LRACVPTNWCDPMLTGPENVLTGTVKETAVEAVLRAVKDRITKRSNVEFSGAEPQRGGASAGTKG